MRQVITSQSVGNDVHRQFDNFIADLGTSSQMFPGIDIPGLSIGILRKTEGMAS